MIDLKEFDKKKITKPSEQLSAEDVGSLVKVITAAGVEITDVLVQMLVHRSNYPEDERAILVRFEHVSGEFIVRFGMRVIVQRPIEA